MDEKEQKKQVLLGNRVVLNPLEDIGLVWVLPGDREDYDIRRSYYDPTVLGDSESDHQVELMNLNTSEETIIPGGAIIVFGGEEMENVN